MTTAPEADGSNANLDNIDLPCLAAPVTDDGVSAPGHVRLSGQKRLARPRQQRQCSRHLLPARSPRLHLRGHFPPAATALWPVPARSQEVPGRTLDPELPPVTAYQSSGASTSSPRQGCCRAPWSGGAGRAGAPRQSGKRQQWPGRRTWHSVRPGPWDAAQVPSARGRHAPVCGRTSPVPGGPLPAPRTPRRGAAPGPGSLSSPRLPRPSQALTKAWARRFSSFPRPMPESGSPRRLHHSRHVH